MERSMIRSLFLSCCLWMLAASGVIADSRQDAPVLISGTFLLIRDGQYQDPDWVRKHFLMMKDVGIDTVIIMWIAHQSPPDKAESPVCSFYYSKILSPFSGITDEKDPMQNIFRIADELNMKVISAVDPLNGPGSKQDVVRDKKISSEIFDRFGKYKSFYGWYFSNEYSDAFWVDPNFRRTVGAYYKEMVDHLHQISGKPVSIAPYFNKSTPEKNAAIWSEAFKTASFDIIMLQDGVGCLPLRVPLEEIRPYYAEIAKACQENKVELWSDLESFAMDTKDPYLLHPAPPERIKKQIEAVGDIVKKIVIYQFSITMAPPEASCNNTEAGRKLYEEYRRYYQKTAKRSPDLAVSADAIVCKQSGDGENRIIEVPVRNIGNHQVGQNIDVWLFSGAVKDGRRPIQKKVIPYLLAGQSQLVTFEVPSSRFTTPTIHVVIDQNNRILERDKANNRATKQL